MARFLLTRLGGMLRGHGHRGRAGVRAHARRAGRPDRGAARRPGHRRGHRARAEGLRPGPAAAGAVRPLAARAGARQPGRVDLPAAAGDAGAVGAGRADRAAVADGDCHCRADRRALRHRLGGVPRQGHRPGLHRLRDARRQRAQFLVRPGADADLRGVAGLVPGLGLRRAGRVAGRAHPLPGAAGHRAGRAQFGADHPLHPRLDARRAGRGLRAHGARQGPVREHGGAQACAAQRAGAHRHGASA